MRASPSVATLYIGAPWEPFVQSKCFDRYFCNYTIIILCLLTGCGVPQQYETNKNQNRKPAFTGFFLKRNDDWFSSTVQPTKTHIFPAVTDMWFLGRPLGKTTTVKTEKHNVWRQKRHQLISLQQECLSSTSSFFSVQPQRSFSPVWNLLKCETLKIYESGNMRVNKIETGTLSLGHSS